jgi:hypothetical protein
MIDECGSIHFDFYSVSSFKKPVFDVPARLDAAMSLNDQVKCSVSISWILNDELM